MLAQSLALKQGAYVWKTSSKLPYESHQGPNCRYPTLRLDSKGQLPPANLVANTRPKRRQSTCANYTRRQSTQALDARCDRLSIDSPLNDEVLSDERFERECSKAVLGGLSTSQPPLGTQAVADLPS